MGSVRNFSLVFLTVVAAAFSQPNIPQSGNAQSGGAQSHVAQDLGHEVLAASLDPEQCYHVHDLQIHEGDVSLYLTEGYLIFGKPVNGAPVSAVFTTDTEGGDAEVLVLPPDRAERRSMASFTGTPNLDEHFTQGVFFFTEKSARALATGMAKNPQAEKAPDVGVLMKDKWNLTVTSMMTNFQTRILLDLLSGGARSEGFFEAAIRSRKLSDFDLIYDARMNEQIAVGRIAQMKDGPVWDTWSRFTTASRRGSAPLAPEEQILSYKIDATLDDSLAMHCVTRVKIRATEDSTRVIPFEVAGPMRVLSATVDGVAAEVSQRESGRGGLVEDTGNELFLVLPATPLTPGTEHEIEITHESRVVSDTGNGIYFVSARGTWYPARGPQFADYDATYHYPATLNLVAAGAVVEDHTENGIRTTRRVPQGKLRLLGFNLGHYNTRESAKSGITLNVSANQTFEKSLQPVQHDLSASSFPILPAPGRGGRGGSTIAIADLPALPQQPADRIAAISNEIQAGIEYFRTRFGDPPLKQIDVSPVPGRFGQGFAGMIYLPTMLYLEPNDLPSHVSPSDTDFYARMLWLHETAHQWWGNIVITDSYHDEWLMESIANYSAMMYLESRMGNKATEKALDYYRTELLQAAPDGNTIESQGPVVAGRRLESSAVPNGVKTVMYGKGTWVIHMLRRKMGDANFTKMLSELRRRYDFKVITTDQFRQLCAEFLPAGSTDPKLNDFFEQWVYSTGVPTLKFTYTVTGRKLTGTVTQSDTPEDFSAAVPVEIRSPGAKPIVKIIRTSADPVKFTVDVAPGAKAVLDPGWSILRR